MQKDSILEFHAQILAVMRDCRGVPKSGRNNHQGYDYSSEVDILGSVRPAMVKHGLFMFPAQIEVIHDENDGKKRFMTAIFTYEVRSTKNNHILKIPICVSGQDFGDKAPVKCATMAQKYAVNQLFMLLRGVDPDNDANNKFDLRTWASDNLARGYGAVVEYAKHNNHPAPSKWSPETCANFVAAFEEGRLPIGGKDA